VIIKHIGITQLQSDALTLRLVREIHQHHQVPQGKLYHQAQNASACARQAVAFRQSETSLDLTVMPLLRYYSLLNTLKALLYLFDLDFPQSTTVLQHGVSVRRTKRSSYQWTWESVMLHKDGIAQTFTYLQDANAELPARLIMGDLLGQLPQMTPAMHLFDKHFIHAYPLTDEANGTCLVSRDIASNQGQTIAEWKERYGRFNRDADRNGEGNEKGNPGGGMNVEGSGRETLDAAPAKAADTAGRVEGGVLANGRSVVGSLQVRPATKGEPLGLMRIPTPIPTHPWLRTYEGIAYLRGEQAYPLWLAHYGLLYTLSALCRYSPSEWSDIVLWHSEPDALLVREYFKIPPVQLYLEEGHAWEPASSIRYGDHSG
jgi:hypothetical protein